MAVTPRFILDTDHISLLQRGASVIAAHLRTVEPAHCAVTAITLAEQVQGRLAQIHASKHESDAPVLFRLLQTTVMFYQAFNVLPYDEQAVAYFLRLRQAKLRIGTQDLRIAAVALVHGAVVVTRNRRDFGQVPGLSVEDWTIG